MAVNTQRAWAPDLFSHGMIQCVLGVSLQNCKKCKEKCYCEPVNWKCIIFSLWKLNNCNDKPIHPPPKKKYWFIFLFIAARNVVKYLSFPKVTGFLPLIAVKSSDNTVSTNQINNLYGSQYSQNTLSWHPLSSNGTVNPMCVSIQLWKRQEAYFCETGFWGLMLKKVFSTCES